MKYFKKLVGERCYLSPIHLDDTEQYCEWLNDLEVAKYLVFPGKQFPIEKERKLLENMIQRDAQIFAIVTLENDILIGNTGFHDVDNVNRTAEFGIFIGDKNYWGKGFGTEATKLMLDYGFNVLNLNNILLRVYAFNPRAANSYKKAGFKIIGIRRQAKIFAGKKWDEIFMDILAEDFDGNFISKLIPEES
jgi:RimJ/RimL family protein N-acetyltransferase